MRRVAFILSLLTLLAIGVGAPQIVHVALEHSHALQTGAATSTDDLSHHCHGHHNHHGQDGCDTSSSQSANHGDKDCSTCDLLAATAPLQVHPPAVASIGAPADDRIVVDAGRLISVEASHDAPTRAPPSGRA